MATWNKRVEFEGYANPRYLKWMTRRITTMISMVTHTPHDLTQIFTAFEVS